MKVRDLMTIDLVVTTPEAPLKEAARLMVKRTAPARRRKPQTRPDKLQENGDWQGAATWHRILDCIGASRRSGGPGGSLSHERACSLPSRRSRAAGRMERQGGQSASKSSRPVRTAHPWCFESSHSPDKGA